MAKIVLNTPRYCHLIDESDIVYCKAENSKTIFFLKEGKEIRVSKPLQYFREQLCKSLFINTHRAYIVNLKFLESINCDPDLHVITSNNRKIPVASSRKKEVVQLIKEKLNNQIINKKYH